MMIAEIDQKELLWPLVSLALLLMGGAVSWKNLTKKDPAMPQPLEIRPTVRVATFEELSQLRKEFEETRRDQTRANDTLLSKIDEDLGGISDKLELRSEKLNEKIETSFREATKVSTGEVTKVHNRVNGIGEQLGRVLGILEEMKRK